MSSSRDGNFKFTVDQMLGKLSRWLRLMGYDVFFPRGSVDDTCIIEKSRSENRIIITKDYEVYVRYPLSIFELYQDLDGQIYDFLDHFKFNVNDAFKRCPVCNGILKEFVGDRNELPEGVRKLNHVYVCTECKKLYWNGSHYYRILKKLREFDSHQKRRHS